MKSFIQFLSEMPLSNYAVGPYVNKTASNDKVDDFFNSRDRIAINNKVIKKDLENILAKSTGYHFNVILLEKPRGTTNYKEFVANFCHENNIPLINHITFAKNSSTGDPLTPWMLLHNIGHALFNNNPVEIIRYLESIDPNIVNTANNIFMFNSAVNSRIIDINELSNELVAEYLWHGKIRHKQPNHKNIINAIENSINNALRKSVNTIIIDHY